MTEGERPLVPPAAKPIYPPPPLNGGLLDYGELRTAIAAGIGRGLDIYEAKMKAQHAATGRATTQVLVLVGILVLLVVVPVAGLAWTGRITGDATTFVFGVIVGAAFGFLRDFFPHV